MLRITALIFLAASLATSQAAITISGLTDKTKYNNTVTFTVTADPGAATTTATVDGAPVAVGSPVTVTAISYHELKAESRDAGGALVDSRTVRFIVKDNAARGGSEDGIPVFTPFKTVNDAPSAFAGLTLDVIAPAAWPVGVPVPMAFKLVDGANETVRLNGMVAMAGFPATKVQMRRGWGSVNAPAATAAGTVQVGAFLNGLTENPSIQFEAAPVFTAVSGNITSNTTWPAHSRIHVTGGLTVDPGATLTIGEGSIVKVYTGTATNGSAAEIRVDGTLQVNGTAANPVAFIPDTVGQLWGGIELRAATSMVNAQYTFFTGSGEDDSWFGNNSGVGGSTHQQEQVLFLVVGSGSGTNIGAQLHLADCFCIDNQQIMNSKTNVWVDLSRTLYQRAITSGELNGAKLTIDRSALIEFPSETGTFVDDDNDALYITAGDLSITNTVIGFTKDDGVDSGGSGGSSPFGTVDPDSGTTTTRYDSANNWYEGAYHEGNSLSGTRNVYFTGCVFLNNGQGVEAGYSNSGTSDGPHAKVTDCLFVNNMVGVRWGDNYGSGYSYNAAFEVKDSIVLGSFYKDTFSGQWHPTQSNAWIYQTMNLNSFGNPYFNVHDNLLSQHDTVNHPLNTQWNGANPAHAALLDSFMPVPGSNVGVAVSTYAGQQDTSAYATSHTVRLSTFSSSPVSVAWAVVTKANAFADAGTVVAGGTLNFAPGETIKTIDAPIASPGNFGLIHVVLSDPVNAEVTGEKVYVKQTGQTPNVITYGSTWKYKDDGSNQGTAWRNVGFNDSGWASGAGQLGYGDGDEATVVASGPANGFYATTYFRRTFEITDKNQIATLAMTLLYDDSGIVYLNGTRVLATTGMPVDPAFNYYRGQTSSDNATLTGAVDPALLVNGTNTIAVEIHQESATSSDISFDLRLTATLGTQPLNLNYTKSADGPVFWWFGTGDVLEFSTDLLNWYPFAAPGSPVSVDMDKPKEFYRLRRPE